MLEHLLDWKQWGGVEWLVAFVAFNAIVLPLAFRLDVALFDRHPRIEAVLGWIMLPVLAATACWWWAEDLQKAGLPAGWAGFLGAVVLVVTVASVPVRIWLWRRAARREARAETGGL